MNTTKVLICPNGGEEIVPMKVWESRLPDGSVIHYGQLHPHTHYGQECEWVTYGATLNRTWGNLS